MSFSFYIGIAFHDEPKDSYFAEVRRESCHIFCFTFELIV